MITLQKFYELVGDAVVAVDSIGQIIVWNPAAERLFGFTKKEALGSSLDLIIPPKFRQRHWRGYRQTLKTGITKYGTSLLHVPALKSDESIISIALTVILLPNENNEITSMVAIIRDESSTYNEIKALHQRLSKNAS